MKIIDVERLGKRVVEALSKVVVGKDDVLLRLVAGILADGHILIEDNPGLAKTLIARLLGQALDLPFKRIQFTPDLLPGDITGSFVYDQRTSQFEFRHGPLFTNLLLADEINRATPKTQSALLEAMQEGQITADGYSYSLEKPFLVIATQNPIEFEGTYPLPEAQLDRFIMRLSVGYPTEADEREMLRRRRERRAEAATVPQLLTRADLTAAQRALEDVHVSDVVADYMVAIVRATRGDPRVALGASPRGSLALQTLTRAAAALSGRDFVTPDDVKTMSIPSLAHRLVLRPEQWLARTSAESVMESILGQVPTPKAEAS